MGGRSVCTGLLAKHPDVLLTIHHPNRRPAEEDWDLHCVECRRGLAGALEFKRDPVGVVFSDGPGPSPSQLGRVQQIIAQFGILPRASVVSRSTLIRGICTAASWKGLPFRAFAPSRWRAALDYLGLNRPEVIEALRAASGEMVERLGALPRSLEPFLLNRD